MLVVSMLSLKGSTNEYNRIDLTFVDVVWLFLFVSIYWWGSISY